jgi:hypothetical protein
MNLKVSGFRMIGLPLERGITAPLIKKPRKVLFLRTPSSPLKSSSSSFMHISFVEAPKSELEIIPYLDGTIQRMRELIDNIISKDPSLRRKFAPKKRRT